MPSSIQKNRRGIARVTTVSGYLRWAYQQKNRYSCGYYCAKALINSLGNGSDRNLVKKLRLTKEGVNQNNLIKTLRSRGLSASIYYNLTLEDIQRHLSKGKYLIVYRHDVEHWLVLHKVSGSRVYFYDPENEWKYREYSYVKEMLNGFGIVCGSKITK